VCGTLGYSAITQVARRRPSPTLLLGTTLGTGAVAVAALATPHRDALTNSEVHQAVSYRPITRYEVTGGYLNLPGLTACDPFPQPNPEEPS